MFFKTKLINFLGKKGAIDFRKVTFKLINDVRVEHPQFLIPKVSSTLLMSPGGPEAITLLYKLSNLAMFIALGGYYNKENHYPVVISKVIGKVQLKSIQTVLDKTMESLYVLVASNQKIEKSMCEFYHQQVEKKQIQQIKLEEVLNKKNKLKSEVENCFFESVHEFESFKSTVKSFWELVSSAALATDKKFNIVKSALEAYKSKTMISSQDINFKIPSILLNKYHKSMFKEIGSHFIDKGEINLSKFIKVCCFGLDLIGETLDNIKRFNLNNKNSKLKIKEQLEALNNSSSFLDKLLLNLEKHNTNYDTEVKNKQNTILQGVSPNEVKNCGFNEARLIQSKNISTKTENSKHDSSSCSNLSLLDMAENIKMHNLATPSEIQSLLSLDFNQLWKQPFNVRCTNYRRSSFVSTKLIPKTPVPSAKLNKKEETNLLSEFKDDVIENEFHNQKKFQNQVIGVKSNENHLDMLAEEVAHSVIENTESSSDEFSDEEPDDFFNKKNNDIISQVRDQILKSNSKQKLEAPDESMPSISCSNTDSNVRLDSLVDTFEITNNFAWDLGFEETKDFLDISISSNENNTSVCSSHSTLSDNENNVNQITNSQTKVEPPEIDLMYFGGNIEAASENSICNTSEKNISVVGQENDFEQWKLKSQMLNKKRRKTRISWYKCIPEANK